MPLDGCNLNDFDTPPIIKSGHRPLYPVGRLVTGETGSVKAEFAVTSAGDITDVQTTVVGSKYFGNHLRVALRSWILAPATRQGQPVGTTCKMEMHYDIR